MKLSQPLHERITWLISNLDLFHKSESEAEFDRLQRAAQDGVPVTDLFPGGQDHYDFMAGKDELPSEIADMDHLEYDYDNILSLANLPVDSHHPLRMQYLVPKISY